MLPILVVLPLLVHDEERPAVEVALLADVTHVVPGASFELGVKITIEPEHWHVYWENPGDSGLATEAKVTAPRGFEVGELRFPAPYKFSLPGDITSFGYENEVVLFVPVRAPKELEGSVAFTVDARWLVCKELCYLGEGSADLELELAPKSGPANAEVFAPYRERLPRRWSDLEKKTVAWTDTEVAITVPGADEVELFPLPDDFFDVVPRASGRESITLALERVDPRGRETPRARGILRVRTGERERFYAVDLRQPARKEDTK